MAQTSLNSTGVASSGALSLQSNGTTSAVTIDTSQNVGVSTGSPTTKLDVLGSGDSELRLRAGSDAALIFSETTANKNWKIKPSGGDLYWQYSASAYNSGYSSLMVLQASGNLGIGITSPVGKLNIINDSASNSDSSPTSWGMLIGRTTGNAESVGLRVKSGAGISGTTFPAQLISNGANLLEIFTAGASPLVFGTGATERARIDSSGNFFLAKTSDSDAAQGISLFAAGEASYNNNNTGTRTTIGFRRSGTSVGSISTTTSSTAYNTSSDYRLKDITGPITTSGAYIDSLNPVEGTWKADGSTFVGLIAHEAQEASRTQVATGVKDGEQMQGMDYSSSEIIANLIAEIQSLRQRVASLESN
jgi:hypothetical protein